MSTNERTSNASDSILFSEDPKDKKFLKHPKLEDDDSFVLFIMRSPYKACKAQLSIRQTVKTESRP